MSSPLVPQSSAYVVKHRPKKPPSGRTAMVSAVIKLVEAAIVEAYARQEGLSKAALVRRALLVEATGNLLGTPENQRLEKELYAYYGDYTPDWMKTPVQDDDDRWFLVSLPGDKLEVATEAAKEAGFKNVSEWLTHLTESVKEPSESASMNPEDPSDEEKR